jgi:hypothetical protein
MTEIRLEALAWEMSQGSEGLAMATSVLMHIALHLAVTSVVAVFVLQATKYLHGGVTSLDRRGLVIGQDLIDDRPERPQDRGISIPGPGTCSRLGMRQDMADCLAPQSELASNSSDGFSIPTGSANGTVIIHCKHFLGLRAA